MQVDDISYDMPLRRGNQAGTDDEMKALYTR